MTEKEIREKLKKKLSSYNSIRWECKQLADELERLESTMTSPRVQALDGMPKGAGGGGDAMASVVAELMDLQARYKDKLHRLNAAMAEVEDIIDTLDNPTEQIGRASCRERV